MRSFLSSSACNGCRPKKIGPARQYERPRLMKRLLAERHVARFLIAPAGMGKTSLAIEYAEAIFSWRNVYWVDCQSPCFLRDLDAEGMAAGLGAAGAERGSLVVFEDVPYLDGERARLFSSAVDELLECGVEIIATTTPMFDAVAMCQSDCVCVRAAAFLVDDAELEHSGCGSARMNLPDTSRMPALVWGGEADESAFLAGMHAGEMPASVQLAVFIMLALQEGEFCDVAAFCAAPVAPTMEFVAQHYPYAGVRCVEEAFCTLDIEASKVVLAFSESFASLVACSVMDTRDRLVARIACALAAKGRYRRACDFMREVCTRAARLSWIEEHQDEFFDAGQVLAMQDLYESVGHNPAGVCSVAMLGAAMRAFLLEEAHDAEALAMRVLAKSDCTPLVGCAAALLCALCGCSDAGRSAKIGHFLEKAASWRHVSGEGHAGGPHRTLGCLAAFQLAMPAPPRETLAMLAACCGEEAFSRMGMVCMSAALAKAAGVSYDEDAASGEAVQEVARIAQLALTSRAAEGEPVVLAEALLRSALLEYGGIVEESPERGRVAAELTMSLEGQRRMRRMRERSHADSRIKNRVMPDESAILPCGMVPEMRVRLFGGMEVSIGGRVLDPTLFYKQKAKTLLAILILYRGREVPRSELFRILWPHATKERAAGNFYPLWSVLTSALSDERGECPYLVRHQASYQIDSRYVRCDVDEFDELCRHLLFDDPDAHAWIEVFGRLQESFSCDLLPSETENAYIVDFRERLRGRLVDAYVRAAGKLCDVREAEASLWFAQAAFESRNNREDVYYALMRAQMLSGQRTCAIDTYFRCRDFMAEELGLDPSDEMTRLYERIICEGHALEQNARML